MKIPRRLRAVSRMVSLWDWPGIYCFWAMALLILMSIKALLMAVQGTIDAAVNFGLWLSSYLNLGLKSLPDTEVLTRCVVGLSVLAFLCLFCCLYQIASHLERISVELKRHNDFHERHEAELDSQEAR